MDKTTLLLISVLWGQFAYADQNQIVAQCLDIDRSPSAIGNTLFNKCSKKINVHWYDEGNCRSGDGCGTSVEAHGKNLIGAIKGTPSWAACYYPDIITGWRGGSSSYKCGDGYSNSTSPRESSNQRPSVEAINYCHDRYNDLASRAAARCHRDYPTGRDHSNCIFGINDLTQCYKDPERAIEEISQYRY